MSNAVSSPLWIASRGSHIVSCELVRSSQGRPLLRCASGSDAVIRSQFLTSEDAATVVAETWKTALLLQGFRLES
jgi:hypothetical protein